MALLFRQKNFQNKSENKMSLRLLLPANKQKEQEEKVIVKRLHSDFKSIHQALKSEIKKANLTNTTLVNYST